MTDLSDDELDELLGKGPGDPDLPSGGRWIGVDIAKVEIKFDVSARSEGYPWNNDIDYDPRFDEDLERED